MYKHRKGHYETKQHKMRRHKLSQKLNKLSIALKRMSRHLKSL